MNTYKITDLYLAAYLKARGMKCDIEKLAKRCFFIFPEEARDLIGEVMKDTDTETFNVNAMQLINEIKQLKAFVNNI